MVLVLVLGFWTTEFFADIRHVDGVNLKEVSEALGNASIQIIMDTYAHV
jgi:hypothetical protein